MRTHDPERAKSDRRASDAVHHFKSGFKLNPETRRLRSATYSIDLEKRFVLVKFTGTLTFQDIEAYASDLRSNPRFSPSLAEMVDLSDVRQVDLSPTQAMYLADRLDPFSPASRRAFVAQSPAQINASHMHRILRPTGNIRVFFSIGEARRWIET